MAWIIACKVEGGVTGTRESFVKNRGEVVTFDNRREASHYANTLSMAANNVFATARFTYSPMRNTL